MASITNSTWSFKIFSPTETSIRTIFPGVGAGISIDDTALAGGEGIGMLSGAGAGAGAGAAETVPPGLT